MSKNEEIGMFASLIERARRMWASPAARKFRRNKLAWVGLAIVSAVVFCAIFADFIAPHDPIEQVGPKPWPSSPSREFLLGVDSFGRDIFSRIIHATRLDLELGLALVGLWTAIGVPLGLIAGYYGGKIDSVIMRVVDGLYAFPYLVFAIAMAGLLGFSLSTIIIALGIIGWPQFARVVRGKVLAVKTEVYVESARAFGEKDRTIMLRYVFPNSLAPLIVIMTLSLATSLIIIAALTFLLPVGVQTEAELGSMLHEGFEYIRYQPWWVTSVGLAIVVIVLGFNFLGDGLRDALDPRLRY